ncbi:MAG: hypothetical protein ACTSPB_03670 [Candidatus Thorarchaeota archaeon]
MRRVILVTDDGIERRAHLVLTSYGKEELQDAIDEIIESGTYFISDIFDELEAQGIVEVEECEVYNLRLFKR